MVLVVGMLSVSLLDEDDFHSFLCNESLSGVLVFNVLLGVLFDGRWAVC